MADARLKRPSTLIQKLMDGEIQYVDDILSESKKWERRMRRRLALARGYDSARA